MSIDDKRDEAIKSALDYADLMIGTAKAVPYPFHENLSMKKWLVLHADAVQALAISAVGPHEPPMVYDPNQGKMVRPGGERALVSYLRQLFDKTAEAHSEGDYADKVNAALVAVYAYGRRQSVAISATNAHPPGAARLIEALLAYEQADMDGVMVKVSRQACDEAAEMLAKLCTTSARTDSGAKDG